MNYDKIADLIRAYGEYETLNPDGNLTDFGGWLAMREAVSVPIEIPNLERHLICFYEEAPLDAQISILLRRMHRYQRHHFKQISDDDINLTQDDFGFLIATFKVGSGKKSDVIAANLMEITTGTEIIARLVRLGLMNETSNPEDRRSKLVSLTAKGVEVLKEMMQQIYRINTFFSASLTAPQKRLLVELMGRLNAYHAALYFDEKHLTLDELVEKFAVGQPDDHSAWFKTKIGQFDQTNE